MRTGDLGRFDSDGYLWITGRSKDIIIRGGHNIDPGLIEEALLGHQDVAFAGAIGQPCPHSGELPCAYVELVAGATVDWGRVDRALSSSMLQNAPPSQNILKSLRLCLKRQLVRCSNPTCAKWPYAGCIMQRLRRRDLRRRWKWSLKTKPVGLLHW